MTAITANRWRFEAMNRGLPGFVRFYAYLGAIVGVSAFAALTTEAYEAQGLLHFLTARAAGWIGIAALAGLLGALGLGMMNPKLAASKLSATLLPWLDGLLLMIALTFVFALLEPSSSLVSYADQTGLVSGRLIMAMNMMFLLAAVLYIVHLFAPDSFIGKMGTSAAWIGVYAGGVSLFLRWYESYLIDPEIGHAPVSNLYEVFILLFCITGMIYLAIERRYQVRALGAFVMALVAAGVFFGIWLDSVGQADIKPLVPALQSYWMKIHVPLNFIGYGAFAVACGAGAMYLVRQKLEGRGGFTRLLSTFPTLEQLDELAYKAVAIGFPAFTLATILGAAWAAEAWGGYWSWDPKETWALIVWLVYGAYLHVRFTHGWQGKVLAWWAVGAFLATLFCFLGVNLYLSGLHSYGQLS